MPRRRRSSDFGERWFCGDCGTQIAMRVDHQPDTIDFTIASLDSPELLRPGFHIFFESRLGMVQAGRRLSAARRHFAPKTRGVVSPALGWCPITPPRRSESFFSCGSEMRKRVYSPGFVAMPTRPPALFTRSRTTSMPMPRAPPSPTVVKPGRKIRLASLRGSIVGGDVGASARPGARPRRGSCRGRGRGRRPAR